MQHPRLVALAAAALMATLGSRLHAAQESREPVTVPAEAEHPEALLELMRDVRGLRELGRLGDTVPDFAGVAAAQLTGVDDVRDRLDACEAAVWSVHMQVDLLLLRSQLDQLEFTLKVRRPTTRDPGFYLDAAIRNVRRHLTGGRYLRGDIMPYSHERAQAILRGLSQTGEFLDQGRRNLSEIVPELAELALKNPGGGYYTTGEEIATIEAQYAAWARATAEHFPRTEAERLIAASAEAARRLSEFGEWVESVGSRGTGSYAFGLDAVDWYHRHVLFLPYSSQELLQMADLERARSLAFLQMEAQKNRRLQQIGPARTSEEYLRWDDETALLLRRWYTEDQQILTDRDYVLDVRQEPGLYLPPFGLVAFPTTEKPGIKRILLLPADNWRARHSNMGFRTAPGVLHGHEYWPGHYYEGELRRHNPCPIRRSHRDRVHSQGWCFYNEELPVLLDFPYVRGPRARELVYINNLQRAERISLGLKIHAAEMTPAEAMEALRKNVPAIGPGLGARPEEALEEVGGMLRRGLDHCQTGKLQIFRLLADRRLQLGDSFDLRTFHDQLVSLGSVPFSLLRWEIAGLDDEVKLLRHARRLDEVGSRAAQP